MRTLKLRVAALAVLSLAAFSAAAAGQEPASPPAPPPDVQRLGPQVGQRVPDFTLVDQHAEQRSLRSLMGEKGLILVFSRSADW
jgi:cytochrome oxidase Cu insertion factor (SCO1/SenC/PrrC family)